MEEGHSKKGIVVSQYYSEIFKKQLQKGCSLGRMNVGVWKFVSMQTGVNSSWIEDSPLGIVPLFGNLVI